MGLLDELGKVLGKAGGRGGQVGGQGALLQAVVGMLGNGGLDGLVRSFQQKGLGDVVGSWVSTGANLPVSADQVSHALGPDMIGRLARESGLDAGAVAGQLSSVLPGLVDKLTPGGSVPAPNELQNQLGSLLGKLLPR